MFPGFLLIDKPEGVTSHDVVDLLRKKTKIKKIGHTGTLDPFATGLLVMGIGEALKAIPYLREEPKVYEAILQLGKKTDTLDLTGKIVEEKPVPVLDENFVNSAARSFVGKQSQIPPMFSAKKIEGKKLYELARVGQKIERQPQPVEVYDLCMQKIESTQISFTVSCSKGTYVRTLAETFAEKLGTVGHLSALRRLQAGCFDIAEALDPDENWNLEEKIFPIERALAHLPAIELGDILFKKAFQGQPVSLSPPPSTFAKAPAPACRTGRDKQGEGQGEGGLEIWSLKYHNKIIGLAEFRSGQFWPKRMLNIF